MEQNSELIYGLDDRPSVKAASYAALQHVLASFVGIITPTLIIGGVLGLGEHIPYLISMALMVSGVGTFIQARKIGPVGAGMICVQGTSFAFLGSVLGAGFLVKANGGGPDEMLATIFGVCFFGAFVEIVLSRFIEKLKVVITPVVTGIVITTIGVSLIKVGVTDIAGGVGAEDFGSGSNLMLGAIVLGTIVALNLSNNTMVRLSSILVGLVVGWGVAILMGKAPMVSFASQPLLSIPIPFKYGFAFDWQAFLPIAFIYLITVIETTGDLTANSMFSGQPVEGPKYINRLKAGVLGDGVNSLIAAVFNTFPNTTFSQNNGVIHFTGIASRYIGYFIAAILFLLGLFPILGAVLMTIPKPVLGGATLVMFGTVAAAGIKIIASEKLDRRRIMTIAISLGLGLGVMLVPDLLKEAPKLVQSIFGSPVTMSGVAALVITGLMSLVPETKAKSMTNSVQTSKA
ncbi:xanthine permease XanP [Vibrio splendidus]|uniref:Nucleobase:cation symporter-2 family protein n=1 Tax=Vibrio splendidus TaxID=29497 RepID=A0AB35MVE3_VIBSP|nr:nucleobase:cation symporter-2 family protein [Vibrio splendidus]MDP2500516.1 nucleobase:cation symporter-2 family protein [Vibrio splendidus]PMM78123.1 xanthine permease XanP [Vibrio splendidus]